MKPTKDICVYAASSPHLAPAFYEAAYRTGQLLARCGFGLINGAGREGLMKACTDGALQEGGTTTGIIPRFMLQQGWQYEAMTHIIPTPDMHTRKQLMADKSAGAIALPGGYGTLEELAEIITWKQLGLYDKPIVILNTNNFYTPLIRWFSQAVEQQFVAPRHAHIWHTARTPEEAVEYILQEIGSPAAPAETNIPTETCPHTTPESSAADPTTHLNA